MFDFTPCQIGPIRLEFPVVLAPLAGYTDLPYRQICRELGSPYCATEMMLDRLLLIRGKLRPRLFAMTEKDHPLAGQIIGNEPAVMAQAAAELDKMGFDVVDLNFACPVHKALSRRRGGFLMTKPEQVLEIVRAVRAATNKPVTIKLRQKFGNADTNDNFWRIAEGAFEAGVAAICVHARSVETKYFGPADWTFLAAVKRRFPDRTIVGSGDAVTPDKIIAMLRDTGVDAAAVARGALGNPWIFRQVRDVAEGRKPYKPSLAEQRALLLRHFEDSVRFYGPDKGPKHMRGFGAKYARLHPHPKEVRMRFVHVKKGEDWHKVLNEFYPVEPVGAGV